MEIQKFTESDIKEATELAFPVWGEEHAENGGWEFGLLMCEYIIRYGWYGEKYALKIVEDGKIVGVILAGIMNVIWWFVGGFAIALTHLGWGLLFCITIVGIPFGIQHFKLMKLAFCHSVRP